MKVRFMIGLPKALDASELGVEGWEIVRGTEKRDITAERLLLLAGCSIALAGMIAALWYAIDGRWLMFMPVDRSTLAALLLTVAAHEAIHFLALPKSITERNFGISSFGAFVSMTGIMTKTRAVLVLVAPFAAITLGPILWRIAVGQVNEIVIFVSIWNGAASIFDIRDASLLLMRVPTGAVVHAGTGSYRFEASGQQEKSWPNFG